MGWINLNASLSVSAKSVPCKDGVITATVTVSGRTDDTKEVNSYTASLRDDYVIPDILWDSGPQSVGASMHIETSFPVEVRCNEQCHIVGPGGSSGERVAELYAHVISEELESASDEIKVSCER